MEAGYQETEKITKLIDKVVIHPDKMKDLDMLQVLATLNFLRTIRTHCKLLEILVKSRQDIKG